MTSSPSSTALRIRVWTSTIPLQITISTSSPPFYINAPRLSYLPLLLPRLFRFFAPHLPSISDDDAPQPHDGWFSYEGVPLKWHYPLGLLHDLYAPRSTGHVSTHPSAHSTPQVSTARPWHLHLHFSPTPPTLIPLDASGKTLQDAWINTLKESDYLRHGSAKAVMSLSLPDSDRLWRGVCSHNLPDYWDVMARLLNGPGGAMLRHVPVRVYVPSAPPPEGGGKDEGVQQMIAVHQPPLPVNLPGRVPVQGQTVGTALHTLLPNLFPSRRTLKMARPLLHGVPVSMEGSLEELMRWGCGYQDGFLHLVIELLE